MQSKAHDLMYPDGNVPLFMEIIENTPPRRKRPHSVDGQPPVAKRLLFEEENKVITAV